MQSAFTLESKFESTESLTPLSVNSIFRAKPDCWDLIPDVLPVLRLKRRL